MWEPQDIDIRLTSDTPSNALMQLPEEYRCVPPTSITQTIVMVLAVDYSLTVESHHIPLALQTEFE